MRWDEAQVARWLEPLAPRPDQIAEIFGERLHEITLEIRDGEVTESRVRREEGVSARWRRNGREQFVFVPGADEAAVAEAIRTLRAEGGATARPKAAGRSRAQARADDEAGAPGPDLPRSMRRLAASLSRHAPRHRLRCRLRTVERRIVSAGRPGAGATRRLLSVQGRFTAASRPGDEERSLSFHAPDSDGAMDELKTFLAARSAPRDRAVPVPQGSSDAVLAEGCAAVLFHEILGHPLEADAEASPLSTASDARVSVADLDVRDDPGRLDLFGGYESDDEGTSPRAVRLLHSGRVGQRLTDRAHGGAAGSTGHGRRAGPAEPPRPRGSNLVVGAGSAPPDELARRLGTGIWIEEFESASVDLSSGTFRLRFPRARRVRRGRLADELGAGILSGAILDALRGVEPVLGTQQRACRSLGWCGRGGQVVPVQGAAPEVLIRGLHAGPAL